MLSGPKDPALLTMCTAYVMNIMCQAKGGSQRVPPRKKGKHTLVSICDSHRVHRLDCARVDLHQAIAEYFDIDTYERGDEASKDEYRKLNSMMHDLNIFNDLAEDARSEQNIVITAMELGEKLASQLWANFGRKLSEGFLEGFE